MARTRPSFTTLRQVRDRSGCHSSPSCSPTIELQFTTFKCSNRMYSGEEPASRPISRDFDPLLPRYLHLNGSKIRGANSGKNETLLDEVEKNTFQRRGPKYTTVKYAVVKRETDINALGTVHQHGPLSVSPCLPNSTEAAPLVGRRQDETRKKKKNRNKRERAGTQSPLLTPSHATRTATQGQQPPLSP